MKAWRFISTTARGCLQTRLNASGITRISIHSLTFGCFFFDYDLDGRLDILGVNGHVSDDINVVQPTVKYAQPAHLFRNDGKNKFEEVTDKLGKAMQMPIVGRGAAYGDFDNDGDLDLLLPTTRVSRDCCAMTTRTRTTCFG